jgi:hypothetical protein
LEYERKISQILKDKQISDNKYQEELTELKIKAENDRKLIKEYEYSA